MREQPEYSYERYYTLWAVYRWRKAPSGSGYIGERVETWMLKEDARKRTYELNGWKWKG